MFYQADCYVGGGNSKIFYFHPYLGKMNPFWQIFRWVETTKQLGFSTDSQIDWFFLQLRLMPLIIFSDFEAGGGSFFFGKAIHFFLTGVTEAPDVFNLERWKQFKKKNTMKDPIIHYSKPILSESFNFFWSWNSWTTWWPLRSCGNGGLSTWAHPKMQGAVGCGSVTNSRHTSFVRAHPNC